MVTGFQSRAWSGFRPTLYLGPDWGPTQKVTSGPIGSSVSSNPLQRLYTRVGPEHWVTSYDILGDIILMPNPQVDLKNIGTIQICPWTHTHVCMALHDIILAKEMLENMLLPHVWLQLRFIKDSTSSIVINFPSHVLENNICHNISYWPPSSIHAITWLSLDHKLNAIQLETYQFLEHPTFGLVLRFR